MADNNGARFTYEEVCAMQFARRAVIRALPADDGHWPVTRAFMDAQLRLIDSALAKMENACDPPDLIFCATCSQMVGKDHDLQHRVRPADTEENV